MARKIYAELLGTFLLVFFAVGVATLMFGFKFDGGSVAAGVVANRAHLRVGLLSLAYVLGPVSGRHVSPRSRSGRCCAGASRLWRRSRTGSRRRRRDPRRARLEPVLSVAAVLQVSAGAGRRRVRQGLARRYQHQRRFSPRLSWPRCSCSPCRGDEQHRQRATAGVVIGLTLTVVDLIDIPIKTPSLLNEYSIMKLVVK